MSKRKAKKRIEKIKQEKSFFAYHLSGLDILPNTECFISFNEIGINIYSCESEMCLIHSIKQEYVLSIEVSNDKEKVIVDSKKSVFWRTIFGYAILGGVGAIIGGVSAILPKVKKQDFYIVEIITKGKSIIMKIEK